MRKFTRFIPMLSLCLCASLGSIEYTTAQNLEKERAYKNEKITVRISNEPLSKVIEKIAATAKVRINFQGSTLIGIDRPTTINESDKPLDEILNKLLEDQNVRLRYEIGRTIILEPIQTADTRNGTAVRVEGTVIGTDINDVLIGATVTITDGSGNSTGVGCITDADGKFSINVPRKASIQVSYIGYKSQSFQIRRSELDMKVALNPNTVDMDQVVVTGISKRSKNSFTGNYVTVKGEELRRVSPTNILRGLQFYDPSFKIVENNSRGSDPNAQMDFQIRGDQTLGNIGHTASNMELMLDNVSSRPNVPLFVLDGFTVPISRILNLDPERVESITILKDAAATAIYGSNAANGVIVVETKVAPDGALSVSYSGNFTVQAPDLTDYNLCNAEEKLRLEEMAGLYESVAEMNLYNKYKRNILAGVDTYWLSQPLRTALQQQHSVTAGGGTDVFRYTLGVSLNSTPGVMKGSSSNTKTVNLNMSYRKEKITVGADITLTEDTGENSPYGDFADYSEANPYYRKTNDQGTYDKLLDTKELGAGFSSQFIYNPLYDSQFNARNETSNLNIAASLNAEYMLLSNLRLTAQMSYTRGMVRSEVFRPADLIEFDQTKDLTQKGRYEKNTGELMSWASNLGINYNLQLNKHLVSLFGNWTVNEDTNNSVALAALGYPDEHMDDFIFGNIMSNRPSGTEATSRSMGLTGQFSYSYDNIYSFDFNIRADMSSRFGEDNRVKPFWSAGVRWNAYREKWLEGRIPNLTFRASYGITGSQSYDPYQAIEFYSFGDNMRPYTSFGILGATLQGLNNSDLGWSETSNLSLSMDLGFWQNRINMSFSYYDNITKQLLVNYDLAPSTGFASQTINAGELQNRGFDASLNVIAFQDIQRQIYWTIGANANHNKNKVRKLSNQLKKLNEEQLASTEAPLPMYQEGLSTSTLNTVPSLGIDPSSGKEVYLTRDGKKTFVWNPVDKVPVGDTNPKVSGSINSSFNWKDLSFSLNMTYKYGAIAYNNTLVDKLENRNVAYNMDRRALSDRWLKPGDVARYKVLDREGSQTPQSSRFIMDDNELALASISLGYRLREEQFDFLRKCSINAMNVSFTTNDLARWSTIKMERGLSYPFARSYTVSLSIIFK